MLENPLWFDPCDQVNIIQASLEKVTSPLDCVILLQNWKGPKKMATGRL